MSSYFTPEQVELLSASVVRLDFLFKFEFVSETLYAWNGNTPLTIDANVYQPMYGYGQVEGLGFASGGTTSESVTLSLNGLPGQNLDVLALALAETPEVDQQLLTVSMQLFDEGWQPVGSPIPLFRGYMQPPKIGRSQMQGAGGGTQSISVTAENIFFNRSRPSFGRYTDRDQQARSAGDFFFRFASSLKFKTITYPDY